MLGSQSHPIAAKLVSLSETTARLEMVSPKAMHSPLLLCSLHLHCYVVSKPRAAKQLMQSDKPFHCSQAVAALQETIQLLNVE